MPKLIGRNSDNFFNDINITSEVLFDNFELTENDQGTVFDETDNTWEINTNGTNIFSIDQSGNLVITGTMTANGLITDCIQDADGTTKVCVSDVTDVITFETSSLERMRIATNGLVGIGTNNPSHPLHIDSANAQILIGLAGAGGQIVFGNSSHGIGRNTGIADFTDSNDVIVYTAGSGDVGLKSASGFVKLNTSGNFGINVEPSVALDVNGSGLFTRSNTGFVDTLKLDNQTGGTGAGTRLRMESDTATAFIDVFSGSFSTSGSNIANSTRLQGTNGLTLETLAGDMIFYTNSSERMRILSDGSVAIGSTVTTSRLVVNGNTNSAHFLHGDANTTDTLIHIGGAIANQRKTAIITEPTGGFGRNKLHFALNSAANLTDTTKTDAVMTLIDSGNVGIGTNSPEEKLHLFDGNIMLESSSLTPPGIAPYILFDEKNFDDRFFIGCDLEGVGDSNKLHIGANSDGGTPDESDAKITLVLGGNVGIGTITPSEVLQVIGNIRLGADGHENTNRKITSGGQLTIHSNVDSVDNSFTNLILAAGKADANIAHITFETDGLERVRFDNDGNVGIGINVPTSVLDIRAASDPILLIRENATAVRGWIHLGNSGHGISRGEVIGSFSGGNDVVVHTAGVTGSLGFQCNGGEATLHSGGNFGVGVTVPLDKLHINGNIRCLNSLFNSSVTVIAGDVPHAVYALSAQQTTTNLLFPVILWNIEVEDRGGFSVASGLIAVPATGLYRVDCMLSFVANTTGVRAVYIRQNSNLQAVNYSPATPSGPAFASASTLINITNISTVKISTLSFQNSGGNLNVTNVDSRIVITRVGSAV